MISAHNVNPIPGAQPPAKYPLPDIRKPYIDLFCAQTGMILSLALSLLGKELDRDMANDLLETGVTHVTDFYSRKKKRNFVADLCLVLPENGSVRYELSFPNEHD